MPFLPNCTLKIYKLPDTTTPVWTGNTNANGRAIDINGNPPLLRYGNYKAISEHCNYDTEIYNFTIPGTSVINMSIGCTSSITNHETIYDHSKLSLINTNLLANVIPTVSGFTTFPSPINELTDDDWIDFTTPGWMSNVGIGTITFNLGSMKYISTMPYLLKYQLNGSWYAGGCPYSNFKVSVYNGLWFEIYSEQLSPTCYVSGGTYYNTGQKTINGIFAIYDNISQVQISLAVDYSNSYNEAYASINGTRIKAIG